jgi:tripartite-type tricarboxylate transporter receptor subunit TctC
MRSAQHSGLALAVLLTLIGAASPGRGQDFPTKPIRLIVPFAPGGGLDILARLLSQKMFDTWKQPVVVDFRAGAAGNIGAEIAAKSPADGYTLLLSVSNLLINPLIYTDTRYDVHKDFAPLSLTATAPQILVAHASVPAKSIEELVALARTSKLTYATTGIGSVGHLSAELLSNAAGIRMINVPYKGSGAAATDLLGGHVQLMFSAPGSMIQYIKTGRLRALAITSSKRAGEGLEDVPTFIESGYPAVEVYNWFGMFAPAGTPLLIIGKLNREIVRIIDLADVRERIVASGYMPVSSTPAEFTAFIRAESAKWEKIVKAAGVRAN